MPTTNRGDIALLHQSEGPEDGEPLLLVCGSGLPADLLAGRAVRGAGRTRFPGDAVRQPRRGGRAGRPGLGERARRRRLPRRDHRADGGDHPPRPGAQPDLDHVDTAASVFASPGYPLDDGELRERVRTNFARHPDDPRATARQQAALVASGDRRKALRRLDLPTLVLHGDADRVIRPSGGRATARAVPGARLVVYRGMGHDLPAALVPTIADEIAALAAHSRRETPPTRSHP